MDGCSANDSRHVTIFHTSYPRSKSDYRTHQSCKGNKVKRTLQSILAGRTIDINVGYEDTLLLTGMHGVAVWVGLELVR